MLSIHDAAKLGDVKRVEELLDANQDPNSEDDFDRTALFYATLFKKNEVTKLLLQRGANVNARGAQGSFHFAISTGDLEIVTVLIENAFKSKEGFNPNQTSKYGSTPRSTLLFEAITMDKIHPEIIRLLLSNGAKDSIECEIEIAELRKIADKYKGEDRLQKLIIVKNLYEKHVKGERISVTPDEIVKMMGYDNIASFLSRYQQKQRIEQVDIQVRQSAPLNKEDPHKIKPIDTQPAQLNSKQRFFDTKEQRDEIHKQAKQHKHAKDTEELKILLKNYIARIEDHVKDNKDIDFGWNFKRFKDTKATNREANYNLARDLLQELEGNNNVNIKELFSKPNIERMRSKYQTAGFWGGSIWSNELSNIISDANKIGKKMEKHKPVV